MLAEKRIERDLNVLQTNLQKLLGDFKDLAKEEVSEGVDRLQNSETVENLRDTLAQVQKSFHRTKEVVQDKSRQAVNVVEQHPVLAVFSALGLGIVLGKFLTPNRR